MPNVINPGGGGSAVTPVAFGTAAARPAASAGNNGTAYFATDTGEVTFSNGAAWSAITSTSGAFTANGLAAAPGFNVTVPNGGLLVFAGNSGLFNSGNLITTGGSFDVTAVGQGMRVKEGANAKQGIATLVAGAVTVANTSVTANSRILLTSNADGGTPGFLRVSARVAGTSFTITSSSGTDTSTVAWQIFEPG